VGVNAVAAPASATAMRKDNIVTPSTWKFEIERKRIKGTKETQRKMHRGYSLNKLPQTTKTNDGDCETIARSRLF